MFSSPSLVKFCSRHQRTMLQTSRILRLLISTLDGPKYEPSSLVVPSKILICHLHLHIDGSKLTACCTTVVMACKAGGPSSAQELLKALRNIGGSQTVHVKSCLSISDWHHAYLEGGHGPAGHPLDLSAQMSAHGCPAQCL